MGDRIERGRHVARFRRGRRVVEGPELVLARVVFVFLARHAEAALTALAAIVGSLVSAEEKSTLVSRSLFLGYY